MHILYFVLTLRELKIIFQTFTTSGTSKLPVPHLFYFCFSFPTFPSPLSAFSLLCKWEGIEENTQLTQRNRSGENVCSPPHSTQSWLGLPSCAITQSPSDTEKREAGGGPPCWRIWDIGRWMWPRGQTRVHNKCRNNTRQTVISCKKTGGEET